MGGLGPGIGGFEVLVIGLVALLVVGPRDLPVLMRRIGQFMARMRAMANEFRASFDEMARQSELDELRKEVQALRQGQGIYPLGAEADAAFRDIRTDLSQPLAGPVAAEPAQPPAEWPEQLTMQPETVAAPAKTPRKPRATKAVDAEAVVETAPKPARKPRARKTAPKAAE
jgi:sec-independent protein translocase protein TatB